MQLQYLSAALGVHSQQLLWHKALRKTCECFRYHLAHKGNILAIATNA